MSDKINEGRPDRLWMAAFVGACIVLVAPLWVAAYPPLVDLPQHAVQIAIARGWFDPRLGYSEIYEFNPLAHQMVAYGLAYLLSFVVSVPVALKLVLSVAIVGVPSVTLLLVRATGGDRWWVLSAFPVAISYAFSWGFLSFVVATPLGLLFVWQAIRYSGRPSRRSAAVLAVLGGVVFVGHVLVLAFAGCAAVVVVWFATEARRDRLLGVLASCAVVPVVAAWWFVTGAASRSTADVETSFEFGVHRLWELPSHMLGASPGQGEFFLGLVVLILPFLIGARPSRTWWRWAPFGVAMAMVLVVPLSFVGTGFLYPRYTVFLVPTLLVALEPHRGVRLGRGIATAAVLVYMSGLVARFAAFDREAEGFGRVVAAMEQGRRVLSFVYSPRSEAVDWTPYLHFGSWYAVERGGVVDFSFAEFFPNRFRYRLGTDPNLPEGFEWEPGSFSWQEHGGANYDYYLLKRVDGSEMHPFGDARARFELVAQSGQWSVYRQILAP